MSKLKQKYKVGQNIWYIANGYVTNDTIKAVFVDRYDDILYSVDLVQYQGGEYRIDMNLIISECDVFPTKEALIKSIKEQEEETYD